MAHHSVKDKDHWLASKNREEFFGPLGVTNIRTFVDPQNPNQVGLMMDVPDLDADRRSSRLADGRAAADVMAEDGVEVETLVLLLES